MFKTPRRRCVTAARFKRPITRVRVIGRLNQASVTQSHACVWTHGTTRDHCLLACPNACKRVRTHEATRGACLHLRDTMHASVNVCIRASMRACPSRCPCGGLGSGRLQGCSGSREQGAGSPCRLRAAACAVRRACQRRAMKARSARKLSPSRSSSNTRLALSGRR